MSMVFYNVTLFVLWHISPVVGFIIIKTTLLIDINILFIFRWRDISIILNVVIQLIPFLNYFVYFLQCVKIVCCIICSLFIIWFYPKCDFIIFEPTITIPKICTYLSSLWLYRNIWKFSQPMASKTLTATYR